MSSRMSDDEGGDATDQRVHDVMDKMDDLGFGVAAVDAIDAALRADNALAPGQGLTKVVVQLLADLAAFAHGKLRDANENVQQELFDALKAEGPSFLSTFDGRVAALDFLLSEVQAAKMLALAQHKKQQMEQAAQAASAAATSAGNAKKRGGAGADDSSDSSKRARGSHESASAASATSAAMEDVAAPSSAHGESAELSYELRLLAHALHVVLPGQTDGPAALRLLRARLQSWLGESPLHQQVTAAPPLFKQEDFTPKQLAVLRDIHSTFTGDYTLRVRVLRKRLEVTLQSFMWGGKGVALEEELSRLAAAKLATFPSGAHVDLYELWAATHTVLHIARMTSREYAQQSSIKRVIIGAVPDRGGRVDTNTRLGSDYEMPAFQARTASSGGGGGGHSGGHGGRGGGGGGGGHRGGRGGKRGGR